MSGKWRDCTDGSREQIVPTYYVNLEAKGGGDGSIERPWRTLKRGFKESSRRRRDRL
jgi:hypothetical protein